MLKELVDFAYANGVASYVKLISLKYREMRRKYLNLPSMYVVTACRDAATRVKSFLTAKRRGRARTDRPTVRKVSIGFTLSCGSRKATPPSEWRQRRAGLLSS